MCGHLLSSACLLLATALPARAAFSEFFFAGNNGTGALKTCPESGFECAPPSVCSFDDRTQKYYCCIPGNADAVCWGPNSGCDGGDSTTPSGGQQACSSGANTFCCLKSSETCTETADQINICWSQLNNPLASLNATAVNETAQSLESNQPSAATYAVSLSALQALTSTTAAPSSLAPSASGQQPIASATSSVSSQTTSSRSEETANNSRTDSGLSSGAIGGVVGGLVGGLALLGLAGFFFWRRTNNGKRNPYAPANSYNASTHPVGNPSELDSNHIYTQSPVAEKYGHAVHPVSEVPADRAPAELPDSSTQNR
ncbi:hypothetical protein G6011_00367 [Alternaria panax]|uniref:Mid2 domain-containing protein n=1 Tax=Alternaria panax TaxID=48097 RepID=A0AAD4NUN7_9PLEO|nr:hypothetical protein G6011_00367 [Alternaria panax]